MPCLRKLKTYWKYIVVLSFCLLIPLLIAVRSVKPPPPVQYDIAGQNVPALGSVLGAEAAAFDDQKVKPASTEETEAGVVSDVSTFRYRDLLEGGHTVEAYIQHLTDPEQGFESVDEKGASAELPDFSADGGTLTLKRKIEDSSDKLWIQLLWKDTRLTMTSYLRSPTEEEQAAEAEEKAASRSMSASDAVIYLKTVPPKDLGLPGETMENYNVYYADGKAIVDGVSCVRLRVYEVGQPEGTNSFLGTYFLSGDQSRIFRLNPDTNQIEELN